MADLLRDALTSNNPTLGLEKSVKDKTLEMLNKHELVPDNLVLKILQGAITKYEKWENVKGLLIEGFPRNMAQAKDWDNLVIDLTNNI